MARDPFFQSEADTAREGVVPVRHPVTAFVLSLRPDQWTKNLIVFAGLIFGERLLEPSAFGVALWAFVVFCGLSSAMYLLNDLADREEDQRHPTKSKRPIAAGQVSTTVARVGAAGLVGVSLGAAFWLQPQFGIVCVAFLALLISYTRFLKRLVILDVLAIAAGFVLRAVGGAVAVDVPISQWLLVCTVLLALFLGLTKRRHEIVLLGTSASDHRLALADYSPQLLDQLITIAASATIVSYALYTAEPTTVENFGTDRLTWTLPFPIYGVFRYLYLVHRHKGGGSPSEMLLRDRPLLACVALWAMAIVLIIYRS
jgi:4-hydroxybenzoate polyprenyltransferase